MAIKSKCVNKDVEICIYESEQYSTKTYNNNASEDEKRGQKAQSQSWFNLKTERNNRESIFCKTNPK